MKRIAKLLLVLFAAAFVASCSSSKEFILHVEKHEHFTQPLAPPVDYEKITNVDDIGYRVGLNFFDKKAFIGNLYGEIYEIDAQTGSKKLIAEIDQPIESNIAFDGENIYVGSNRGILFKISSNGRIIAKKSFGFPVMRVYYVKGKLYVGTENDIIYCLNPADLSIEWKFLHGEFNMLDIRGISGMLFGMDGIYVGFDDGSVDKISYKGDLVWEVQASKGTMFIDCDSTPVKNDQAVYIASTRGYIEAVNPDEGNVLWKRKLSTYANLQLNIFGVYVADENGYIYCLDNSNGETIWKKRITAKGNIFAIKLVGKVLYAITDQGRLVALDNLRGDVLDIVDIDDDISSPFALCCNRLFVVSRDGSIYSIFSR